MFTYLLLALVAMAVAMTVHLLTRPGMRSARSHGRIGAAVALATLGVLAFADVAHAQDIDPDNSLAEIRLSALTVTLLISVFIPIVTAVVTKLNTSSTVKGVVTLVLNLVNAAVVGQIVSDGSAVFSQETLVAALVGMAISVASYLGFYKPVDLNAKALPDVGL